MSFKSCTMWSQIKIPMREGRVLCCQSSGGSDSSDYLSYWVQIDSWYHGVQAPDLAANGLLVSSEARPVVTLHIMFYIWSISPMNEPSHVHTLATPGLDLTGLNTLPKCIL